MGEDEITRFLSALAVHRQVSASTQNQALSAVLFYVPTAVSGQLAAVSVARQPGVVFGTLAMLPARVTAGRLSTETRAHDILPDGLSEDTIGKILIDNPRDTYPRLRAPSEERSGNGGKEVR